MLGLFKAIKHGCIDGWNGTTQYKHLYYDIEEAAPPNENILEEIEALKTILNRQYEIGDILEKELTTTYDLKKRSIILNKLNTLDKQTLRNLQRLKKLEDLV